MFGIDTSTEVEKPSSRKTGRNNQKDAGSHGGNSEKRHLGGLANKRIAA
jgi:hypothetical protein